MKTSELQGEALDWAVAKDRRYADFVLDAKRFLEMHETGHYNYSTEWAQGGPIIERGRIGIEPWGANRSWIAQTYNEAGRVTQRQYGPTPLIAAMRCYVASKFGDEVELPGGLAA